MLYKVLEFFSTCFKIGYVSFAPGTFGSIFSLLMWFLVYNYSLFIKLLIITTIFFLGVYSSEIISKKNNLKDPGFIVIDEFVGMWITLLLIPNGIIWYFLGFLFFRFFDIVKFYPANVFDKMDSGIGIMFDDVISGLYAGLIVQLFWIYL